MARDGGDQKRPAGLSSADSAPNCAPALALFPVGCRGRAAAVDNWHRVVVADGVDGLVRCPFHHPGSDAAYADAGDWLFVYGSRHQPDRYLPIRNTECGMRNAE